MVWETTTICTLNRRGTAADVIENFRNLCQQQYGLHPTQDGNRAAAPDRYWNVSLHGNGYPVRNSMMRKRYAKVIRINPLNNLYDWAISKSLPIRGFKWRKKSSRKKTQRMDGSWISSRTSWRTQEQPPGTGGRESRLYVGLPKEFERQGGKTPGQREAAAVTWEQKQICRALRELAVSSEAGHETEVRAQSAGWSRTSGYIHSSKNDFEKNFYKLMNNSVFDKTMENLRNRVDLKVLGSNEADKIRKMVASPLYSRHEIVSNDIVGINMHWNDDPWQQ